MDHITKYYLFLMIQLSITFANEYKPHERQGRTSFLCDFRLTNLR